ncbi:hypothetical protein [Schleiferilactobacillus perolens]|nr:hypothetical protein [Schleiferilactobacillus perolens]
MNKEDAKKQIAERLELASRLDDPLTGNQKAALVRSLQATVDAIEVEHKPVVLPQKVGEYVEDVKNDALGDLHMFLDIDWDIHGAAEASEYRKRERLNAALNMIDAYRYGWTPEREKRFLLPMTVASDGTVTLYAFLDIDSDWNANWTDDDKAAVYNQYTVTQACIDSAPAWVKAIKPVEVRHD